MAVNFRLIKITIAFCLKIVAARWDLPPKIVADPEKRLSMRVLGHGSRSRCMLCNKL